MHVMYNLTLNVFCSNLYLIHSILLLHYSSDPNGILVLLYFHLVDNSWILAIVESRLSTLATFRSYLSTFGLLNYKLEVLVFKYFHYTTILKLDYISEAYIAVV